MSIQSIRFAVASTVLLFATLLVSPLAHAQVSGGGDTPKLASSPAPTTSAIVDLAGDPAWQVRETDLGGVRFVQSQHAVSGQHVDIAQVGESAWLIQTGAQAPVVGRTVYRDEKDEVVLYRQASQEVWFVLPAGRQR